MRILSVVGARPQFIKLAPMDKTIRARGHEHVIVHTGQHYDYKMSKTFFDQLEIAEPDYNLEIGSGTHAQQTGQMLERLGETVTVVKPDLVLVFGDTNSTLAGALVAVKLHVPVGHVEAGYRSGDISMPEEVNRVMADRVAQMLFAPTADAIENLVAEGVPRERIIFVGNIMAESLLTSLDRAADSTVLTDLGLESGSYAVLTAHRPENTNEPDRLRAIIEGISAAGFPIVFPAHPRTTTLIEEYGLSETIAAGPIRLVDPMNYIDFLRLQSQARLILTDSGGLQEEAILLGVPCLTLRYNTERVLTVRLGANKMVGADADLITKSILELLERASVDIPIPPNWDEKVSERIMDAIEDGRDLLAIKPEVATL